MTSAEFNAPQVSPDADWHGTLTGYFHHRCRCQACSTTGARYSKMRTHATNTVGALTVPSLGVIRRIRALQAIGWTIGDISLELGNKGRGALSRRIYHCPTVTRETHRRMSDTYDRMCMTPGPSNITRKRAQAAGWAPPLAWPEGAIDDPAAKPYNASRKKGANPERQLIDPVVVERAMNRQPVQTNPAERAELTRRWIADGRTLNELERLFGVNGRRERKKAA